MQKPTEVDDALATAAGALFDSDPRRAAATLGDALGRVGGAKVALRQGVRLRRLWAAALRELGDEDELRRALLLLEGGLKGTEAAPALAAALWLDVGRTLAALDHDDAFAAFAQPAKLFGPALIVARADQEHARLRARRHGPSHPDVPRLLASAHQRCARGEGASHPFTLGLALFGHVHELPAATLALKQYARQATHRSAIEAALARDLSAAESVLREHLSRADDEASWALLAALLQAQGRFEAADVADGRRAQA